MNGPPDWQLAVAFEPVTLAELHETPTAETGTVLQPVKAVEFAATLRVQVFPLAPPLIFQLTVALELPATALPGLFAVNWMVAGDAVTAVSVLAIGFIVVPEPADAAARLGRREFALGFCAHANPAAITSALAVASVTYLRNLASYRAPSRSNGI